jgi:hypothetical protein
MKGLESRDRATQLSIDDDVRLVLEFMQDNIAAAKLLGVAETTAKLARLLWGQYAQEPLSPVSLGPDKPKMQNQLLRAASELSLGRPCADGDSVGAEISQ